MRKYSTRVLVLILLALLMLACNFPGYGTPEIDFDSVPAQDTGDGDAEQILPGEDGGGDISEDGASTSEPAGPTATFTPKPSPTITATPTPTETPTVTATPKLGDPLTFLDPAWEWLEWEQIEGTGDLNGLISARITGGVAPYRSQLDDRDIVLGLEVPLRWRLCKPMPATLKVWSADGQYAEAKIWIWEVGCP